MHARIRNQCSNLNGDLLNNYLSNSIACGCGYETEDADHYVFNCNKYIRQTNCDNAFVNILNTMKELMVSIRKARAFHPLIVEALLFGKSSLSDNDIFFLFQAVQQYIKDTKGRFTR